MRTEAKAANRGTEAGAGGASRREACGGPRSVEGAGSASPRSAPSSAKGFPPAPARPPAEVLGAGA